MSGNNLIKTRTLQNTLQDLADRTDKLTSGNISHQIPSMRSITTNLNDILTIPLINACNIHDKKDEQLKQLLEKIQRNITAIDALLKDFTPMTVNNGKLHVKTWIQFYADKLDEMLKLYDI